MPKMIDPFEIPDHEKPYRMTYQWVRQSVMGRPDTNHIKRSKMAGWRRIKRSRHRSLKASDLWDDNTRWIEHGGLALMERPTHMSVAARQAELDEAKAQYKGWCYVIGRDEKRSNWYAPATIKAKVYAAWETVKWLPQIKFRRVMPRLTYSFKKQ